MTKSPTVKINDKEYKLKITLGFYKKLSFPQSELNSFTDNATRRFEMLKLALFYGNKQEKNWHTLEDMQKEITDDSLDESSDCNLLDKLSEAVYISLPDSVKKIVDKQQKEQEGKIDIANSKKN